MDGKKLNEEFRSLSSAISSLKVEELLNYIFVIGKINKEESILFDICDGAFFFAKCKELVIKYEVEKTIKYRDFKKRVGEYIENMVYEDYKNEMMLLVREAYGSKDENELYIKAKRIFNKEKIKNEL